MAIQNKRAIMTLFAKKNDIYSDFFKITLSEKEILFDIIYIDKDNEHLLFNLNPYGNVPTLETRDIILYEPEIIFEHLEDRYPYPPLLSIFPIDKAHARLIWRQINRDLIDILEVILNNKLPKAKILDLKIQFVKNLLKMEAIFNNSKYLLGDEFSILDCLMIVIFHNLPKIKVNIPAKMISLQNYAKDIMSRKSFNDTLKI